MHMNWRLASRLSVVTLAILVIIVVVLLQRLPKSDAQQDGTSNISSASNANGLTGTDLGGIAAPNFQLTDQNGQTISLKQFQGKPVVLTLMYTHCPDICPLTAEHLHTMMLNLGSSAKDVAIVAVSTDPKRDNRAAATLFTNEHRMQGYWHFLTGSQAQLAPVWTAYSIEAQQQGQNINHSMAIYLIDRHGREQSFLEDSVLPNELTKDMRTLLSES